MQTCIESPLSSRKLISLINDARRSPEEPIDNAPTKMAEKHIAKFEYMLDESSVPSFIYDPNQMRIIKKETRQRLSQTAVSMLEQIPNITRVCQYLISSLDQIAIELEENIETGDE